MSGNKHYKHNNIHFPVHFRMLLADWFTFNHCSYFIRPSVRRRHHHRLLFRLDENIIPQLLKHVYIYHSLSSSLSLSLFYSLSLSL